MPSVSIAEDDSNIWPLLKTIAAFLFKNEEPISTIQWQQLDILSSHA